MTDATLCQSQSKACCNGSAQLLPGQESLPGWTPHGPVHPPWRGGTQPCLTWDSSKSSAPSCNDKEPSLWLGHRGPRAPQHQ